MDLTLFIIFGALSLILIFLGFWKSEHTELTLIGFAFLFLLSMFLILNNVQYKVGENITISNYYTNLSNTTLNSTTLVSYDVYAPIASSSAFNHQIGYWLAVISFIGFIIVIASTRRGDESI